MLLILNVSYEKSDKWILRDELPKYFQHPKLPFSEFLIKILEKDFLFKIKANKFCFLFWFICASLENLSICLLLSHHLDLTLVSSMLSQMWCDHKSNLIFLPFLCYFSETNTYALEAPKIFFWLFLGKKNLESKSILTTPMCPHSIHPKYFYCSEKCFSWWKIFLRTLINCQAYKYNSPNLFIPLVFQKG